MRGRRMGSLRFSERARRGGRLWVMMDGLEMVLIVGGMDGWAEGCRMGTGLVFFYSSRRTWVGLFLLSKELGFWSGESTGVGWDPGCVL